MTDRLSNLEERMWRLEDRYGEAAASNLDEYRRLKQEWDILNKSLK